MLRVHPLLHTLGWQVVFSLDLEYGATSPQFLQFAFSLFMLVNIILSSDLCELLPRIVTVKFDYFFVLFLQLVNNRVDLHTVRVDHRYHILFVPQAEPFHIGVLTQFVTYKERLLFFRWVLFHMLLQ